MKEADDSEAECCYLLGREYEEVGSIAEAAFLLYEEEVDCSLLPADDEVLDAPELRSSVVLVSDACPPAAVASSSLRAVLAKIITKYY